MSGTVYAATKRLAVFVGAMALVSFPAQVVKAEPELPAIGQCFKMTTSQLKADNWPTSSTAIDCGLPHNVEIVGTVTVPDSVAQRGFDSADVIAWASKSCSVTVNKYAGLGEPSTAPMYSRTWNYFWKPSRGEWAAGDRSVICGAGVVKAQLSSKGYPKTAVARGSITGFGSDFGESLFYVAKERGVAIEYTLYARRSMFDEKVRKYPGEAAAGKAARKFCASQARMSTYAWGSPDKAEWDAGARWIYCFYSG